MQTLLVDHSTSMLKLKQHGTAGSMLHRPLLPGVRLGIASRQSFRQQIGEPHPMHALCHNLSPAAASQRQGTVARAYNRGPSDKPQRTWNPVEVVKREQGLQSNKLPAPLREAVEEAVTELRFRVTPGDVAGRAGVKLSEADEALKALAYDAQAALEVSEQGDVVYNFPRDFRSAIQARSVLLSLQPALKTTQKVLAYLVRVAFGTALLASVALVWFVIAVLLSSKDRDNRDSNQGGYYNRYYGGYNGGGFGARVYFDLTDLLIYLDPNFSSSSRQRVAQGAQLTFLEAIFSFVFGDGDPNAEFDKQRWAALGQYIQERGGVVTGEEMAPFLDPPAPSQSSTNGTGYADESFVLPALIRFGGEPSVDEATGGIIYTFPGLQTSGVASERVWGSPVMTPQPTSSEIVQEETWELTAASPGQIMGVVGLGAFNLIGVLVLGSMLADPGAKYALAYNGLGWVAGLMPALQLYAGAFFGIPALRTFLNMRRNADIEARNAARATAARLLNSGARWVNEKLAAARRLGRTRTVSKSDVVFSSEKATEQQMNDRELEEWDKKFGNTNYQQDLPSRNGYRSKAAQKDFDDFRKLLATPRRDAGDTKATPKRDAAHKPKKNFSKPKPVKPEDEDGPKYRDRAEERRRGVNPDYTAANQLLSVISQNGDVEPSKMSVEETKYLGGDLEHTHLVKGLDYALLNKMRSSMTKDEGKEGADGDDALAPPKREELTIKHAVAQGVYAALFQPTRVAVYEQFLPRRTAFVYNFEPDEFGVVQDVPTTLRRSKADCPKPVEAVFAKTDNAVIERIAKIMSYIKTTAGGKKVKKKERDEILGELLGTGLAGNANTTPTAGGHAAGQAGKAAVPTTAATQKPSAAAAADDDDNIFDDVGTDYKPSVTGKKKQNGSAVSKRNEDDMEVEDGEMPQQQHKPPQPPPTDYSVPLPPPQAYPHDPYAVQQPYGTAHDAARYGQQWPNADYAQAAYGQAQPPQEQTEQDVPKWRVRTRKAEERMVDFVDDAYGEYYPMAGGFEVPALEEEDELADGKKARVAAEDAKAPAKPGTKEATQKENSRLNTQLQKIEGYFKEKGYDHSGAFGRTPSRVATGDDPSLSVRRDKRQRI